MRQRIVTVIFLSALTTLCSPLTAVADTGVEEPTVSADEAIAETPTITIEEPLFPIFPVVGDVSYSDTFGAPRHPNRTHHGTDIFAQKMTPVVACDSGIVIAAGVSSGRAGVYLKVRHENGAVSVYLHLNNDTPGTDDGLGVGIAPGIAKGVRVEAGTLLGFVGDSGNAEDTPPHLHFEYRVEGDIVVNSYPLLRMSQGFEGDLNLETLPYTGVDIEALQALAVALLVLGLFLLRLGEVYAEEAEPVRRRSSIVSRHSYWRRTGSRIEATRYSPSHDGFTRRMRRRRPHGRHLCRSAGWWNR